MNGFIDWYEGAVSHTFLGIVSLTVVDKKCRSYLFMNGFIDWFIEK